jgi:hypothetical protein
LSNWKKLVVSGSQAHLASVTASNGSIISGSLTMSGSINNVDHLNFYTTSSAATATGRLAWNDGDGTLDLGLKGGTLALQLGQDSFARVYNAEATTLNKGEIVYISGSQGNRMSVKRADSAFEEGSANTIGMVAENITSGAEGFIFTSGVVNELNTIGLTGGSTLYLSSSGQYTQTRPTAPEQTVIIGFVERVHASVGSIFIKIDNGYEIGELHDILDGTTTTSYGDLLVKSGSVWKNSKQLTGSYGLTGSLQATSFTGSLQGTATTASYVLNAVSSSFAATASTASYVLNAVSSSFALTASYAMNGGGGGASVTNPGNNYLITSDGTAGGLVGETNLNFDGTIFNVTGSAIISATTRLTDIEERELTVIIGGTPSSLSLDLSQANVFEVTYNASVNSFSITNPPPTDYAGSFTLVTTGTGIPYPWNWGSAVTWSGGSAPSVTSTNGKRDIYGFITTNQGTNWYGFIGGQNL